MTCLWGPFPACVVHLHLFGKSPSQTVSLFEKSSLASRLWMQLPCHYRRAVVRFPTCSTASLITFFFKPQLTLRWHAALLVSVKLSVCLCE